jgi:purine/pyrimidine-nucleoside phosphorylase
MAMQEKIPNATVTLKANVYFGGKVVSHTIHLADKTRKTVGIIYPGTYTFDTASAEVMEIIAGECKVCLADSTEWKSYPAGSSFRVGAKSVFKIAVDTGIAEYLCSYEQ